MTGKRRAFCLQNTYESVTVKSSRIAQSGNHSHDVIQSNEIQYFASCCTLEWKVLKTLEIWPKFDTSEILYIYVTVQNSIFKLYKVFMKQKYKDTNLKRACLIQILIIIF